MLLVHLSYIHQLQYFYVSFSARFSANRLSWHLSGNSHMHQTQDKLDLEADSSLGRQQQESCCKT